MEPQSPVKSPISPISSPSKSTSSPLSLSKKSSSISLTPQDFTIKHRLGRGAYGDVFLCTKNSDNKSYAMKQIQKKKLQKQKKQYQALIQKQILSNLKHPAIVKLRYAFQDKRSLYFILQLCEGGQFLQFIKLNMIMGNLDECIKRFYIAEIINILEYLHKNGITHRDVKPQNLMLSKQGHLKIIDFGTADITNCTIISDKFKQKIQSMKKKINQHEQQNVQVQLQQQDQQPQQPQSPRKKQRRSTFVGTCYYISPQLIQENYCPPEADLWALGCIIYLLYFRQTPFKDNYEFAIFQKIKKCQLQFPKSSQVGDDVIDLIKKLLKKNPDERLGSGKTQDLTYEILKKHEYFKGIDVDKVFEGKVPEVSKGDKIKKEEESQKDQLQQFELEERQQKKQVMDLNSLFLGLKKVQSYGRQQKVDQNKT